MSRQGEKGPAREQGSHKTGTQRGERRERTQFVLFFSNSLNSNDVESS